MLLLKRKIRNAYFKMEKATMYEQPRYYLKVLTLDKQGKIKEEICSRHLIYQLSQDFDYELIDNFVLRLTKIKALQLHSEIDNCVVGFANFEILEKE